MRNTLGEETSPYLLQHRDNPVHWQPWEPAALALARDLDKPILLSVGYAACHWCHVMAHESFENAEIAALMNELFVNIKVDREERPDIDAIYMNALHLLGQQGGWPLTMFLTPNGAPFWGGTYFPPESRWGRPGFPDILRRIHELYRDDRDKVVQNTELLVGALKDMGGKAAANDPAPALAPDILDLAAERILEHVDMIDGGLRGAPKFPQPPLFALLWRAYLRTGQAPYREAVTVTLDRMCQGGIYDHLGGGFARYATDAVWLVPHFEKMLYDNALLIELLTDAWRDSGRPLYARRVQETVDWIEREMIAENGAFAASLDADSEGEEGRFYVWSEAEIDAVLGPAAPAFKSAYGVSAAGNWEGKVILNRSGGPGLGTAADEAELERCRALLLDARAARVRPEWDDKVLADWNGLMIAALAQAARAFGREAWLARAEAAFAAVVRDLSQGDRLHHAYRAGRARHSAVLDDYAAMIRAALALFEATMEESYLAQAERWAGTVAAHYQDAENGAYFYSADDAEALIARTRTVVDNATPAGNGVMTQNFARLYLLTGQERHRARAREILDAFAADVRRNALAAPSLLNGLDLLLNATQIVIIGEADDPAAGALAQAAFAAPAANLVLQRLRPGAALPPTHPAQGKGPRGGAATAYVCVGTACSAPITDARALAEALARPGGRGAAPR